MNDYKLIIFDLDGTLADTSKGIIDCHIYANIQMNKPITNYTILSGIIGGPLLDTYKTLFNYSENEAKKAVEIYRNHYNQVGKYGSRIYPGIVDVLIHLKNKQYFLAVATLKQDELAKDILSYLQIEKYFDAIHGVDKNDTLGKKDLLNLCMQDLKINTSNTLLIGDSRHDALGAEALNMDFIGVTYGFGFKNLDDINKYKNIGMAQDAKDILKFL